MVSKAVKKNIFINGHREKSAYDYPDGTTLILSRFGCEMVKVEKVDSEYSAPQRASITGHQPKS